MYTLIDYYLNRITMYRLVLYYLIGLLIMATIYSFYNILTFNPIALIASTLFLTYFSGFINDLLAKLFNAPTNTESATISALILALLIPPPTQTTDFVFLSIVATVTMASKYILAIKNKHIFNPVAIAIVLTAFGLNQPASWWVGNANVLPFVLIGGLLIVRKLQREDMIFTFILSAVLTTTISSFLKGSNILNVTDKLLLQSSLFFLAFVMLTEPLTMPPTKTLQIIYAALVGILFVPDIHIGSIYSTPELALCVGNIFAYIVSPKYKLILYVKEKLPIAEDTLDFIFPLKKKISFLPGQYMEWTLPHNNSDDRGNRRYFTLASSPTENEVRLGVKFYNPPSTYKQTLKKIDKNIPIVASQLAGDFTMPNDTTQPLVFIAGGIGITPFRSMLKYMIDSNEKRDIVVVYSNRNISEIAYKDILDEAAAKFNTKVIYTLTDTKNIPENWNGQKGRIHAAMIQNEIPDYLKRTYYISGPNAMVDGYKATLQKINIPSNQIRTDFFPGFV